MPSTISKVSTLSRVRAAGVAVGIGVGALAGATLAGPLNKAWVAPDAKWVVHIDVDAVRASSLCGLIGQQVGNDPELKDYIKFKTTMGIDPLKDLKGVTVYGGSFTKDDGVAIITATAAVDGFVEKLMEKEPSVKKEVEGDQTFYTWPEHGETRYGVIRPGAKPDERIVVAGPGKERLLAALKQIDTPEPAKEGGPLASTPRKGSMVFGSAASLDSIKEAELSMIFKKTERLVADFGESNGELFGEMTITAPTSEDATRMLHMAQGVLALGQYAASTDDSLKPLANIGEGIKLSTDDRKVTLKVSCSVAQIKELIAAEEKTRPPAVTPTSDSQPEHRPKEKPAPPK